MPNWKKVIVSGSDASLNSLNVSTYVSASTFNGKFTGSLQGSSSYALTSSYALYAAVAPNLGTTTTFTQAASASTWTFTHNLNTLTPQITVYDYGKNVIIPQNIQSTDPNTTVLSFSSIQSGYAVIGTGGGLVITGSTFNFTQASASSTWLIEHPLNTKTPIVQIYDANYNSILTEYISGSSNSLLTVNVGAAQTGYAVLSNGGNLYISGSSARLTQSIAAVTWSFTHSLNTKYPVVQVYNSSDSVIIPATITAIDTNTTQITFATPTSGVAVAEFSGINGLQDNTVSSSYALTASYVNPLNQQVQLTGSLNVSGGIVNKGYIEFLPVTADIDNTISSSYIYVSGSTQDLYFSQNSKGYNNTTRLRWLEGNLFTGLLNGGLITSQSSTVYQISSGSGIIVNLNASLNDNPYPVIQYLNWGNLSASIAPLTASYQQAFVGIDSTSNIFAQGTPFNNGQFDTIINIGTVLFQNQSTINGVKTQPSVAYGFEQQQNVFNRAFGPLKLSGYTLASSGSSTGSLVVGSGTAYAPGSNYAIDPNEPYYTVDNGTNTSKIFRYRQSGSNWVYQTNAGAGYPTIDPTQYSNNGVLTAVPGGGSNRQWSIQRVFWFPNSVAKAIVVYYGNATYATEVEAIANISFESFVEAPNTAANAIYIGAIIVRNDADFTDSNTYKIQPGGLFRQVGGSGGGGSLITQTLSGLSDVSISGQTNLQPLAYSTTAGKWINTSILSASIAGNAATATTASFATTAPAYTLTSSFLAFTSSVNVTTGALNATTGALNATTGALNSRTGSYATTGSNTFIGTQTITGNGTVTGDWTVQGNLIAQTFIISSSVSYFTESFSSGSTKFGDDSLDLHQFTGSVRMTGSLDVTGSVTANYGFTGSLFGTSSWAQSAVNAPYHVLTSSFSTTSASISSRVTNLESTASVFVVASASFSSSIVTLTNASASLATNSGSNSTRFTTLENASASFASQSGSNSTRFTILELASGSLSASVATLINMSASYAIASGSDSARVTRLEGTASAFTIASASFSSSIVTLTNASASFAAVSTSYSTASGSLSSRVTLLEGTASIFATTSASIVANYVRNSQTSSMTVLSSSYAGTASILLSATGAIADTFWATNNGNGINFRIGDDAILGDVNAANTAQLSGLQTGGAGFLKFGSGSSPTIGTSGFDNLSIRATTITITGSVTATSLTGSHLGTSSYAVQAATASSVTTLNQNVIITGSLVVGSGSAGAGENTLIIGPAPAAGAGEGGQILLSAKGDSGYTSASMWDNYQNRTRLLRGSNVGSDAEVASFNMHTRQFSLPAYNGPSAFVGTAVANLAVDSGGNVITVSGAVSASNAATASLANVALSGTGSFTGSFIGAHTGSLFGTASQAISSSFAVSSSYSFSGSYALTASYVASIANLSTTQIATGSVTASVSGSDATFRVISGSNTFLFVSSSGLTIVSGTFAVVANNVTEFLISSTGSAFGNALTDTHSITGSFNITGSLTVTGNTTSSLTASQAISSSFATTASFALRTNAVGQTPVTHTQAASSSVWAVTHSLGSQTPNITIYDFGYNVIIPQNIQNTSINSSTVTFSSPQSGYAVFSVANQVVSGSTAVLSQSSAATTWSFSHNLNSRFVNVDVYGSDFSQIIPSRLTLTNSASVEITFATATAGYAVATINGFSGSVTSTQNTVVQTDGTNATRYITFTDTLSGLGPVYADAGISYNPSTNALTVGTLTETSTIELKQNIKDFVTPLAKFMALQPVSYKWKENKRKDIGFIAEHVQELFPEIVAEDGKSMSYTKLTPILIDIVQRQQETIEEMRKELKAIKRHIDKH